MHEKTMSVIKLFTSIKGTKFQSIIFFGCEVAENKIKQSPTH